MLKELYQYREFLKTSITKEFRGKYKKSFLGVLWSFINPLLQLLIYSIVFSFIMKNDIPHYSSFLVVALIPWTYFSTVLAQSTMSIVINEGILKKVYFPRIILPISTVTSGLINFLVSGIIVIVALIISGIGLSWHIVFLPFIILVQYILSLGFAFILSSITVYIRDLQYFISVIIMMWFYVNPIVYSADIIPIKLQFLFNLNPLLHLLNAYRDVLYYQRIPNITSLLGLGLFSILFLVLGLFIFRKCEKGFVEEL